MDDGNLCYITNLRAGGGGQRPLSHSGGYLEENSAKYGCKL